jgi:mono/diheme cytochrome c family protein
MHSWLRVASAVMALAIMATAQERPKEGAGEKLFGFYCAVCHGVDGRGHGPAAGSLRVSPGDLTQLQRNSGGQFPAKRVADTIRGYAPVAAHGSREMPVWGNLFRKMNRGRGDTAEQRVRALTAYLESMQATKN